MKNVTPYGGGSLNGSAIPRQMFLAIELSVSVTEGSALRRGVRWRARLSRGLAAAEELAQGRQQLCSF